METIVAALVTAGGSLVALFVLLYVAFQLCPGVFVRAYTWNQRRKLGLVARYSYSGSYRFSYLTNVTTGGTTPPLLLLHGFSDKKESWFPLIQFLPKNLHVVALDMPGHGGTSRPEGDNYSIESQVARIHQFVQSIGFDKRPFHLAGISMGGNVSGVYAARHPDQLSGVTLICPAGLDYPTDSEFFSHMKELEKTQNVDAIPLIPSTAEEFETMLKLCCHKQFYVPRMVIRTIISERIPNNSFYKQLFLELVQESRLSLQENLHLITTPLQLIWGKEDKLLDVSGASVIQAALPSSQVELLDDCGHSVPLERPRKSAKLIVDFLTAQGAGKKDA